METPLFYHNGSYRLFGMLHEPEHDRTDVGVVVCHPFAEEKLWSQRVLVNYGRELAANGYTVLRFDFMGHGDSEGAFEDETIETCLADISRSVERLREHSGVRRIGLLGLRFGATLAYLAAEQRNDIDLLMLWAPVINVDHYLRACLRSNLATQMSLFKKITCTREKMVQDLLSGASVNIDGYLITSRFYREACGINLADGIPVPSSPAFVAHISRQAQAPVPPLLLRFFERLRQSDNRSALSTIIEEPFWSELRTYPQRLVHLFANTTSWLSAVLPAGGSAS